MAAAVGISPSALLRAGPVERDLLLAAIPEALEHQRRYIRAQAVEAVNAYAEATRR
ncbi:MAG TPA: hypothetical protein VJN72_00545 [Gaiellales bacterium]|nr:hypothetical protein [Gaiellales bacterium]